MRPKQTVLNSFKVALRGIFRGLIMERNSRIQLVVAVIVLTYSYFLRISKLEYVLIAFLCFLVILLELINTSFEKLLDVIYPTYHPEIGLVKDIMSGVVLLASLLSIVVGIIILGQPTLKLLENFF